LGRDRGGVVQDIHAGVRDVDVETAETGGKGLGDLGVVIRVGDVAGDRKRSGTDKGRRLVQGSGVAAGDDEAGAFGGEEHRDREADAAAAAGYNRDLSVKHVHELRS